jgi:hypothetical protein
MDTDPRTNRADEVLRYTQEGSHRDTLRRHYLEWRARQSPPLPLRCDNDVCRFFEGPLEWNGVSFSPILDHINGVNTDNRPKNLRFLCPLCDSQLPTRGGKNKGRVTKSSGGFAVRDSEGRNHYVLPCEPTHIEVSLGTVGKRGR